MSVIQQFERSAKDEPHEQTDQEFKNDQIAKKQRELQEKSEKVVKQQKIIDQQHEFTQTLLKQKRRQKDRIDELEKKEKEKENLQYNNSERALVEMIQENEKPANFEKEEISDF